MLAVLAAVVYTSQGVLPRMKDEQVWSLLTELGFEAKPYGKTQLSLGTISTDGRKVDIAFTTSTPDGKQTSAYISALDLTHNYRPKRRVSPSFISGWQSDHQRDTVVVLTNLDGSLRLRSHISMEPGLTKTQLKFRIASFNSTVADLCQDLAPAEPGAAPFKLDENEKVDTVNIQDAGYLIDTWGWTYKGPFGSSGPTWVQPMMIDGMMMWMSQPHPGYLVRDRLAIAVTFDAPKGADLEKYAADVAKKLPGSTADALYERVNAHTEIDLAGGLPLKQLKAKILAFAKQIAPFAKGKQGLKPGGGFGEAH